MWGGRFSGTIDERMARFNNSYPFDCRMWEEDIRGSLAWARQIHAAGVITAAELAELTEGLATVRAEFAAGSFGALASDEDIHRAVERRLGRLAGSAARAAILPLGSSALAGTPLAIDRAALAADLGVAGISPNSLDAVSDRDFVAEFLFCAALIGVHLSRLAEDMVLYSTAEF